MKTCLPAIILLLLLNACGDHPVAKIERDPNDTVVPVLPTGPTAADRDLVQSNIKVGDSEMKDDSVFTNGSVPTTWANAGFDDPFAFKTFLKKFRFWVNQDMRDSIAAHIEFPMKNPPVKNKDAFLKNYNSFFDEKVKTALHEQSLNQIFRNSRGAMIGQGELWFHETKHRFELYAINYH